MNKTNLLKNIKNDTYCRLKSSKVSGIGVVAIKDIPANTNPFYLTNKTYRKYKVIKISKKDLKNTNSEVLKIIDDFFHKEDQAMCYETTIPNPIRKRRARTSP